jgi:uncharacterized protein
MEKSMRPFWGVMTLLVAVIIVLLVVFAVPAMLAWQTSFTPARTITITAQGMTTATPDEADIDFSVVTQGTSPQTLSDNNNTKMAAVMQFLSAQNIASSDIETTGYDMEPNYVYDAASQRNDITGYTLTQTVEVKILDLTNVATVLGGLAPLGVNQIGSVNYTFQNPDEFIAIARGQALTNAETEASQMAAQAGASLGEVVTVTESSNIIVPGPEPVYAMAAGGAASAPVTPSLAPGTQSVTDEVTVTYQLK